MQLLSAEAQEALKGSVFSELGGNFLMKLPDKILSRKAYTEVADLVKYLGGAWVSKSKAFVSKTDSLKEGVKTAIIRGGWGNTLKEYEFFATPDEIADRMVSMLECKPEHSVLEPSVGRGNLVNALLRKVRPERIVMLDIDHYHSEEINKLIIECTNLGILSMYSNRDFLSFNPEKRFDRIIMNPPFSHNQDIEHIQHAFELLAPGGRLVAILSEHSFFATDSKSRKFQDFTNSHASESFSLPAGAFAKSGTDVKTRMLIIEKET